MRDLSGEERVKIRPNSETRVKIEKVRKIRVINGHVRNLKITVELNVNYLLLCVAGFLVAMPTWCSEGPLDVEETRATSLYDGLHLWSLLFYLLTE